MPRLVVQPSKKEDVYKDIVRIPEFSRQDKSGKVIQESSICCVKVGSKNTLVVLRGCEGTTDAVILMDETIRNQLGVSEKSEYEFELSRVTFIGILRWALTTTEIGYRIAVWLGFLGFILGVLSIVLTIITMCNNK